MKNRFNKKQELSNSLYALLLNSYKRLKDGLIEPKAGAMGMR